MPGEPAQSADNLALRAWDLMGGEINWSAFPMVIALLGIDDVDLFVVRLVAIQDHLMRLRQAEA